MVNFKKLTDKAKVVVDKRGGVESLKEDAQELREQLLFLSRNPIAAKTLGAAGRRTAIDLFNVDRYLADWRGVIHAGA